jgi:hypothetical protein
MEHLNISDESLESLPSSSDPKNDRTNSLWRFTRKPESNEPQRDEQNRRIFYCMQFSCSYDTVVSTNFRKHLQSVHNIIVQVQESRVRRLALQQVQNLTVNVEAPTITKGISEKLNKDSLREALTRLIVRRSLPFTAVEWPELHALLILLNPDVRSMIPTQHRTIRADIQTSWATQKHELAQTLRTARSRINVSLDIWTSPNTHLFLGVVAHYVRQKEDKISKSLLGLRQIGSHRGEEQWDVSRTILQEFGVVRELGVVIADNASTNDVLCRTIGKYFKEGLNQEWDSTREQIRCIGHIINLIVQAFLFSTISSELLEEPDHLETEDLDSRTYQNRNQKEFRAMGSLGKLHNIIVHIRSSAGRTHAFVSAARKKIPLDNRTRWNSWFHMLETAVELERHIDYYIKTQPDIENDRLHATDWDTLRTTHSFLTAFSHLTLQNEGDDRDISNVLPTLIIIKTHITTAKTRASQSKVRTF